MRFLLPLGLIGLAGIIALIIIYIIKPNFQQKLISSTFIWRLSLKFKKRKIPLSKLRNILLIACQVLIILSMTLILSKTVFILQEKSDQQEAILIIDSSASMNTGSETSTRYQRAVNAAIEQAEAVFDKGGIVSVILAENQNTFLAERAGAGSRNEIISGMKALLENGTKCSYSVADTTAAIALTDRILSINPSAKIYLYTDTTYARLSDNINLVNVAEKDEWNAAILNATAELEDGYYTFSIEVACYGRDVDLGVTMEIFGPNAENSNDNSSLPFSLTERVHCTADQTLTIVFKYVPDEEAAAYEDSLPENSVFHQLSTEERVSSYQSVHISLDVSDSLATDNVFDVYGGLKELIRVQYYSSGSDPSTGSPLGPNVFMQEVFATLKKVNESKWDIEITEVKKGNAYATEGFDFYIFEHEMPSIMPTDGVVLLCDPMSAPQNAGFRLEKIVDMSKRSVYLSAEEDHPILKNMDVSAISVSRYNKVTYDPEYTALISYAGDPMLLVKKDETSRVAVMCFSLHYSNLPLLVEFPLMMYNMFEYFLPSTVNGNAFETQEPISVNSRGTTLTVTGYETDLTLDTFPSELKLNTPGSYTLSQTTFADKVVSETIYVRAPRAESNIFAEDGALDSPYYEIDETDYYSDLLLYLAATLVALILIEWYLQHKDSSI